MGAVKEDSFSVCSEHLKPRLGERRPNLGNDGLSLQFQSLCVIALGSQKTFRRSRGRTTSTPNLGQHRVEAIVKASIRDEALHKAPLEGGCRVNAPSCQQDVTCAPLPHSGRQ